MQFESSDSGLAIMVYEPLYTMLSKYGNCTRLLKIENKLKIGCFYRYSRDEFSIFCGHF